MQNPSSFASPTKTADLRDELSRQYRILMKEAPVRLVTTTLAYGLTLIFLPGWLVLSCYCINLGGEIMSARALFNLDPAAEPARYRACLIWVFILEMAFSIIPATMWHIDGPYMKAFSVGLAVTSIMHVSTVRAIHLPMGLAGFAAIGTAAIATNALLWINKGDLAGLAFTTVCAIAGLGYSLGAIISNNRLHQETARGRTEAQAANVAKGAFLAQMSHELRTPLNAILGLGHAELRRTKDPISLERLSVLISSAEGLSTILDDILDMSSIQGGHLPIRNAPLNLRAEISATTALFAPQIEQAGLTFSQDLAEDLPDWAAMDAQRLRQCLSNLLSNAVKNTATGGITLRAARGLDSGLRPQLQIDVSDTGPGIAEDKAEAIFEPFVRGPGASLGTGLGLSITRALARQMGGDLYLQLPGPGDPKGAHFVLTLAMPPAENPKSKSPTSAETPLELAGRKVLIVDDIASNRLVAVAYLRYFGAAPVEADSGAAALQRVAQGGIDLVLLDMNMPEMDGLQTFAAIRALPDGAAQVPVIAMTANALNDHRQFYMNAGLDGYLAKPVTPASAADEIRRVLKINPVDAPSDSPETGK